MSNVKPWQMVFLGVLAVALIGVLLRGLLMGPSSTAPGAGRSKSAQQNKTKDLRATRFIEADVDIDAMLEEIEVVQFNYALNRIDRNPMEPLVGRPTVPMQGLDGEGNRTSPVLFQMRVTGIVHDKYSPMAVVRNDLNAEDGDTVVSLGHTFENGVQVHDIQPDYVVFRVGDSLVPVEMKDLDPNGMKE